MRSTVTPALLVLLSAAVCSDMFGAHPTAAFTLDVKRREFVHSRDKPIDEQMRGWAETCSVQPRGPLFTLRCRPAPLARRESSLPEPDAIEAALVLFRDRDEVLYVAGCPAIDEPAEVGPERGTSRPDEPLRRSRSVPKAVAEQDQRDCAAIAQGRTFTTQIEHDVMKIVIRGRQLSLTIFDVQPREITTGSPYELKPARTRASTASGALPVSARAPEPGAEPEFRPPPLNEQSEGRPSRRSLNGAPTAKTSLQTGRLVIECASSRAAVYVDDAYYGSCPLELPCGRGSPLDYGAPPKTGRLGA